MSFHVETTGYPQPLNSLCVNMLWFLVFFTSIDTICSIFEKPSTITTFRSLILKYFSPNYSIGEACTFCLRGKNVFCSQCMRDYLDQNRDEIG